MYEISQSSKSNSSNVTRELQIESEQNRVTLSRIASFGTIGVGTFPCGLIWRVGKEHR